MSEESQDLLEILKGIKFVMYIGGPGTGKTTKLKQIAAECKKSQSGVHIIGPTNLNAQCTGGTTIYRYCNCSYTKFESVPFYYPTVLIDEVFMFSERVFSYILECCNESTKEIIMFGDPY